MRAIVSPLQGCWLGGSKPRAVALGWYVSALQAWRAQLAGACYGVESIPDGWRTKLAKVDLITRLADELLIASGNR